MITNLKKLKKTLSTSDWPDKNIRIISFDIFDTLLIRKMDPPEGVKNIISNLAEDKGILGISAGELLGLRNKKEKELRLKALDEKFDSECSITEIMELVTLDLGVDSSVAKELVDIETRVEETLTSPMPGIKDLLAKLRPDYKLIAVSDTYLPLNIIEQLLESSGLREYFGTIYCSCEFKLNKGSGRLFQKVLEVEGVGPDQLIHIGDNVLSDYLVPKGLGINSFHLYEEWNLKRRNFLQTLEKSENDSDFWKGFSFLHKLHSIQKKEFHENTIENSFYSWGRDTVGPLLTLYIHLILKELEKGKIDRLYFVARDGHILQKIYYILSDKIYGGAAMTPHYVYMSRFTSFVSSIKNLSKRELEMSLFGEYKTVQKVMARLGLEDYQELNEIYERNEIDAEEELNYLKLKKAVENLFKDTAFKRILLKHCGDMRELLEKHLRQNGFFSSGDDTVAMVDVGWLGTIQGCIEHAFSDKNDFPHIMGYYLALNPPLFDLSLNKKGVICDYRTSTPDERAMIFFREALEFPTRPDHGATIGYKENSDGTVAPIFADNPGEKRIMPYIEKIQEGILDFAKEYSDLINIYNINPEELKPYFVKNYNYKLGYPNKNIVKAFEELSNTDDFGSDKIRGIVRDYSLTDFFKYKEFRQSLAEIPWKEGSLSKSNVPFIITGYNLAKRFICWNLTKFYYHEQNPK